MTKESAMAIKSAAIDFGICCCVDRRHYEYSTTFKCMNHLIQIIYGMGIQNKQNPGYIESFTTQGETITIF